VNGDVHTEVLIIGAGPAGLTAGCQLARRGIDCVIVEKDGSPFAGSRGKGLQPRTQEMLEDLGVMAEARRLGGLYPVVQAHQDGQVVFEGRLDPLADATPDVPYPNIWMLPQWRTGDLLRGRFAELGGTIRYGTELVSLTQTADEVTAVLRDGELGQHGELGEHAERGELVVRARYLVGADGGHSAVRRALGIGFAGETREEQRAIVADVTAAGVSREFWHYWMVADGGQGAFRLAMCPLAGTGTFQLTAPADGDLTAERITLPYLQQLADDAVGPGQITITSLTWSSVYRTNIRMAERFRSGRAFLVGDAAHVHSPAGGQGLNTGIQDSCNLGWKLAAVLRGAPAGLLDSYEAERLPVAADVLGISTALHDKAVDQDPDALRRDDPRLRQLNLGYRDSALSSERRAAPGPVRAGDRAPDATGYDDDGKTSRIFELLHNGQATLLAFGPAAERLAARLVGSVPPELLRAVAVQGEPAAARQGLAGFTDADGYARRGYGVAADQDVLIVVRPDGYLGLALDASPAAIGEAGAYLAQLGVPT
jgi:2-polyprenyl-6-methoxyphenol hydroxylase-like FAD-dependent oxidoreductase